MPGPARLPRAPRSPQPPRLRSPPRLRAPPRLCLPPRLRSPPLRREHLSHCRRRRCGLPQHRQPPRPPHHPWRSHTHQPTTFSYWPTAPAWSPRWQEPALLLRLSPASRRPPPPGPCRPKPSAAVAPVPQPMPAAAPGPPLARPQEHPPAERSRPSVLCAPFACHRQAALPPNRHPCSRRSFARSRCPSPPVWSARPAPRTQQRRRCPRPACRFLAGSPLLLPWWWSPPWR
mmetsp:Transcript_35769/g.91983  ORF Transcript_35769/g.91983 Transcript_35769/m.91983 type:complete len:231 (+) Transcript_35769:1191-1883(+)